MHDPVHVNVHWHSRSGCSSPALARRRTYVATDPSHFDLVTDRLMQAEVNTVVLARLAKTKLKDDPALKLGAAQVVDGSQLYCWGSSLGGIEGTTFMALPPDGDVTPDSNVAHTEARKLELALKQLDAFLKPQGTVQQFCSGASDPD